MGWIVRHELRDMDEKRKKIFYTNKSRKFIKTEKVYNTNQSNTVIILELIFVEEYTDFLKSYNVYHTVEERDTFNGLLLSTIAHRTRNTLPNDIVGLMKFLADSKKDPSSIDRLTTFFDLLKSIDSKLSVVINFINAFSELKLNIMSR